MIKRGVSFGFLGRFGRSADLRYLDAALEEFRLHSGVIPDGVKMVAVSLMAEDGSEPEPAAYSPVGALMALSFYGAEEFARLNGPEATGVTLTRLEIALEKGEGLDASIILLMLHSGLLHQSLREEYGIEADEARS